MVRKANERFSGHDDVVQHGKVQVFAGLAKARSQPTVSLTRLRIAGQVVVNQHKSCSAHGQGAAEDQFGVDHGARQASPRNADFRQHVVGSSQELHPKFLMLQVPQAGHKSVPDILAGLDPRTGPTVMPFPPAAQFHGGRNQRGLRRSNAIHHCEAFDRPGRQVVQAALRQFKHLFCKGFGRPAIVACPQQKGDQLSVVQNPEPFLGRARSGPLVLRHGAKKTRCPGQRVQNS